MEKTIIKCRECGGTGKETVPPEGRRIGLSNARTMKARDCYCCGGTGAVTLETWGLEEKQANTDNMRKLAYGGRYYRGPRYPLPKSKD